MADGTLGELGAVKAELQRKLDESLKWVYEEGGLRLERYETEEGVSFSLLLSDRWEVEEVARPEMRARQVIFRKERV